MQAVLLWLEATSLSVWIRESTSVFAFPTILTLHAIGMGLAVGVNAAIALRLLGFAPRVPVAELNRFVPVMWFGFWMNAVSGVVLFLGYPTKALTNPVFYLKLLLIAAGMWLFRRMTGRFDADGRGLEAAAANVRVLAGMSLACWAAAVTSGRLLAYTATRMLASW
jgi:uncharacterized oligopeptide transporter (OPT) family protein